MEENKDTYAGFDKDIWPQIQFHNERIYKNLEFFIQITLAICGGLSYLAINKVTGNKDTVVAIVKMGGGIQILLGLYTSLAIYMHALSATRRYKDKSNLSRKILTWLEPYMILFVLGVTGLVAYIAYFKIACLI